jgi:hypothetical protein
MMMLMMTKVKGGTKRVFCILSKGDWTHDTVAGQKKGKKTFFSKL